MDILETFDFVQHIYKPTHNSGHLLDYIITRKDSSGISNLYVSDFICDYRALHVSLTCNRVHPERKQICVRSLKRIIYDALEADLIGLHIYLFWISMHHQHVFMLLTDLCMIGWQMAFW